MPPNPVSRLPPPESTVQRQSEPRPARRTLLAILLMVALGLAGALLAVRLYMSRPAEDQVGEGEIAEFSELKTADRFLMCPPDFCNLPPDAASPVFAFGWERLRDVWRETIALQPRVKLVAGDGDLSKITYIRHGAGLGLPELVTIQFVPLGAARSTFAISSRQRYLPIAKSSSRALVEGWIKLIEERLGHDIES